MSIVRPAQDGQTETAQAEAATAPGGVHRQDRGRAPEIHDGHRETAGTGELVMQATHQVSELIRAEMRLAMAELKGKARHAGAGAGLFGGAGVIALYGVAAVLTAVIAALALVLPVWAAALIVGACLLLVAGVLAMIGRSQARQAAPAMPEQTMDSAKQTVAELKERAARR